MDVLWWNVFQTIKTMFLKIIPNLGFMCLKLLTGTGLGPGPGTKLSLH